MSATIAEIEKVLDKNVRPSLTAHQGNVAIVDYTNHILRIRLTGHCSGCPSAQLTTEELIRTSVCETLTDVQDVILVSGVSDSLIEQAKEILSIRHSQETTSRLE